jgi:hypothetical protein
MGGGGALIMRNFYYRKAARSTDKYGTMIKTDFFLILSVQIFKLVDDQLGINFALNNLCRVTRSLYENY